MHDRRGMLPGLLFALTALLPAQSHPPQPAKAAPLALRLVPVLDGLRNDAPGDDLARLGETTIAKEAAKVGLDLQHPSHPLVVARYDKGRLFYVFYKVTEEAFGPRPWVLQRIRKVERTWATADAPPQEKVTWQVEAFKTQAGELKGTDQHFGSFALRDAHRREIVKEYEIGFGEIPGTAAGPAWPFAADRLFHMLQAYGEQPGLHEQVKFTRSQRWTLTASFGKDGTWSLASPELGLDLPARALPATAGEPPVDAASRGTVLQVGKGLPGVQLGTSTPEEVGKVLGNALEDVAMPTGSRNISYRGALTCNFDAAGKLNTIITRTPFAGRTDNGIAHGMSRADVRKALGTAPGLDDGKPTWQAGGLVVRFDAAGTVDRLVLRRP